MQRRKGDEVGFFVLVNVVHCVTDLLDVDGGLEGSFLRIVTLKPHTVPVVPDGVCGDGRVVAASVSAQM